ncbi:MAG: prolyl-tRNA synthetase associated domain-containing protein [Planctomycetota bacterium]|jgi:Ala-tRNA(Pro) deacylase
MDLFRFLEACGVRYTRHDHPAVFTVEEADRLVPALPGAKTKNLFLRDGKGKKNFLVVLEAGKSADLKALARVLGVKKLGFASSDRLMHFLGLTPGAVSLLGLMNDRERGVRVVIDRDVWKAEAMQCHPLVNTSSLVIPKEGIERFLEATGHVPKVIEVPARS